IHAYYALLLECRDAMERGGLPPLGRHQVHGQARLRLVFAGDPDLRSLEHLGRHRNFANYDLRPHRYFTTGADAAADVQDSAACIALLDAIDRDPVRRAAAVASIRR